MRILHYTFWFLGLFICLARSGFEKIDVPLLKKMGDAPEDTIFRVLVTFEPYNGSTLDKDLEEVKGHLRSYIIYQTLTMEANHTQYTLIQALQHKVPKPLRIEPIWIVNALYVEAVKEVILKFGLDRLPENKNILKVIEDEVMPRPIEQGNGDSVTTRASVFTDWGLKEIEVDPWLDAGYDGKNVIIGIIDSGADATHPDLHPSWFGPEYGFRAPFYQNNVTNRTYDVGWVWDSSGKVPPFDGETHGTKMLGILVGLRTGVARGAKWIMCSDYAPPAENLTIGQQNYLTYLCGGYLLCPDPLHKCSRRPKVINNSWGVMNPSDVTLDLFDRLVVAWLDAKQMPVFAAGNNGEDGCETINCPADRRDVIAVGSVELRPLAKKLRLLKESAKGPPTDRYPGVADYVAEKLYKPNLVGPGENIRTTTVRVPGGDLYDTSQGSSAAAAFVSGAIAVLLSRNSNFNYEEVKELLYNNARTTNLMSRKPQEMCGGLNDSVPNFKFGYGSLKLPDPLSLALGEPVTPSSIPPDGLS